MKNFLSTKNFERSIGMFKKAIGIDIDGVIGDSDKIFRKYMNQYFNLKLKRKDIKEFYYEKVLSISPEEITPFWEEFNNKGYWMEIPLVDNAKSSIDYLKEKYAIILITARTENIKDLTLAWLEKHKIKYDQLHFLNENESKITKVLQNNISLNALIDDKLENALNFAGEGTRVFLFDYPWNQFDKKVENLIRVKGWCDILSYL